MTDDSAENYAQSPGCHGEPTVDGKGKKERRARSTFGLSGSAQICADHPINSDLSRLRRSHSAEICAESPPRCGEPTVDGKGQKELGSVNYNRRMRLAFAHRPN